MYTQCNMAVSNYVANAASAGKTDLIGLVSCGLCICLNIAIGALTFRELENESESDRVFGRNALLVQTKISLH